MGANTPARAATVGELADFRTDNQWSRIHLAIQPAVELYTARVNQTFDSYDGIFQIEYTGGDGELGEVVPNMLLLIGSSAGASDHGICRIRTAPGPTSFYIGLTSRIRPQDEDYLTVIDCLPLCAKHPTGSGTDVRMDYDVEYSAAADAPIPVLGPLVAVLRLTGETVDFTPPDPSDLSWSPIGAALTDYLFDAPYASTTVDLDTTQPTFTYDTPGWYMWSCTITDENEVSSTGYRWLVVEPDSPQFTLQSCEGSINDNGWHFGVKLASDADLDGVRDRAMCVLWTEDYFDNELGCIGPIPAYENILAVGWIEGQSINHNPLNETVEFTVRGPAFWLGKLQAYPFLAADTSTTPTGWQQIEELTADKALSRILHWGSNATQILDCVVTGNTNRLPSITAPDDNLLDQLETVAGMVFALPLCNRFGQLFIQTDPQYLTTLEKASVPVVMDITKSDWRDSLNIQRETVEQTSMLELSAYESYNGSAPVLVHSRASGNIPLEYGAPVSRENFVVIDQDECNRVAGVMLAVDNNEYPVIPVNFACNQRLVDICPQQYCTQTVAEGDTARGISYTDKKLIPRRLRLNQGGMKLRMDVEFEGDVTGSDGIAYYPPTPIYDNISYDMPDIDMGDFPDIDTDFPDFVSTLPGTGDDCKTSTDLVNAPSNGFSIVFDKTTLNGEDVDRVAYARYPCYIRMGTALAKTKLMLIGNFAGDSKDHVKVYGVKGGSRVATATTAFGTMGGYATFSPEAAVEVDGFEIEIDAGSGYGISTLFEEGSCSVTQMFGTTISGLTIGNYYALYNTGGPWYAWPFGDPNYLPLYRLMATHDGKSSGVIGIGVADPGTMGDTGQILSSIRSVIYFQASATTVDVGTGDPNPSDNTGTCGYALYNATSGLRLLNLGAGTILNVCAV